MPEFLTDLIFTEDKNLFEETTLKVFRYQYEHTSVYREFCDALHKTPDTIKTIFDIPFLPVQFFKSHDIIDRTKTAKKIFAVLLIIIAVKMIFFDKTKKETNTPDARESFIESPAAGNDG